MYVFQESPNYGFIKKHVEILFTVKIFQTGKTLHMTLVEGQ